MIELRKKSFFSSEYFVEENGTPVAGLRRFGWGGKAEITVREKTFYAQRQWSGFVLCEGDVPILTVTKSGFWHPKLVCQHGKSDFEIVNQCFSQTLLVKTGESEVGSIRRRGVFSTSVLVDLPDELPLEMRVFLGWVAVMRWSEQATAAARQTANWRMG